MTTRFNDQPISGIVVQPDAWGVGSVECAGGEKCDIARHPFVRFHDYRMMPVVIIFQDTEKLSEFLEASRFELAAAIHRGELE